MSGSIVLALLQNAGLLLAMAFAFDLLSNRRSASRTRRQQLLAGLAMGAIGIAMIATSQRVSSGVLFDTRSVLLAVTGLFMGAIPTAVAVAMTAGYRLLVDGPGSIAGVGVIISSGLIGVLWQGVRRGRLETISASDMYALGLVVHAVMLALLYTIPAGVGSRVVAEIWLPVVLVHPIATVALGMLFAHRLRHWRIVRELHESEERFRLLAENAQDLVYHFEVFPARKFTYVSASAVTLTGYGAEEFYADSELLFKIVHPDDREILEAGLRADVTTVTLRWIRKDGRVVWGELRNTPIVDETGRLIAFEGIGRDVTESRHALEALQQQEERLRLALESSNQGLYDLDVATGIEKASDEYALMLGEDPRGFSETRDECLDRMHPEDRSRVAALLDNYLSGRAPEYRLESRRRHRDGHWIWTLSYGTIVARDDRGRPTRMIGTIQDVTALKQAELEARTAHAEAEKHLDEASKARRSLLSIMEDQQSARRDLQQAQQLAQSTLDALNDHICVLDEDGVIVTVNAAWREFAALNGALPEGETFVGWSYLKVCDKAPAHDVAARLQAVIEGRLETCAVEYPCHSPEEQRWFRVQMTRFLVDGHPRVVVAHENITERRRAEEERLELTRQLYQSQRLESLGSLAGGIAHDINNVLAAISNAASTHRRKLGDAEPLAVALDTITNACVRGRSVVQSLLYFARKELGSSSRVDLNVIVREIVSLLDKTTLKRMRLVTDLEEPLEAIQGDAAALGHAVMNLCLNSADAMPGGGELTITTRRVPESRVEISVRDNGTGMSSEIRARAMEPFFTTKPLGKGSGLGLAMVYGTTKAHGGTCEIRSEPGHGTEVVLSFPLVRVEEPRLAHAAGSDQSGTPVGRLQILLVDDDALILESFPPLLESMGHEVETADSGLAAISRLEAGLDVDLVILDMNMPGLTGAETLPRILELRPEQAVLISTGYSDSDLSELIGDNPRIRSLRKPFTVGELEEALRAVFSTSDARS
ncbi:MAG: PAS domain S-box protein [Thermoanaerobaculia bacterium]